MNLETLAAKQQYPYRNAEVTVRQLNKTEQRTEKTQRQLSGKVKAGLIEMMLLGGIPTPEDSASFLPKTSE